PGGHVGQDVGPVEQDRALDRLGVGIDQQLGRVEAMALIGRVRAVDAVAVALAGPDAGQVAVPVEGGALSDLGAFLGVALEQAQLDALGVLAEQREVRPLAVPRRAERERAAGPHLAAHPSTAPANGGRRTSPPSSSTPVWVARTSSARSTRTRRSSRAKLHTSS